MSLRQSRLSRSPRSLLGSITRSVEDIPALHPAAVRDLRGLSRRDPPTVFACSYRRSFRGNRREPNLRIVRFINEVLPVFRVSGSLPAHAGESQISIVSSSFPNRNSF